MNEPPQLSIEALEAIVRNCQRNEQRLHELERRTRHERKKAERLLRETYQVKQERERAIIAARKPPPVEFFVSFDDREDKPSSGKCVRFNIPEHNQGEELADLSRRCEDLLFRLRIHEYESSILNRESPTNDDSLSLQQSLELLRPDFISHSRQRVDRIHHLRDEREHQLPPSPRSLSTYDELKRVAKRKYEQLPEVKERLRQELTNEIKRRNSLRAKIFRVRLRQHVLMHGRTNIDQSLSILDT